MTKQANNKRVKPIEGSWISIQWNDNRHFYWNGVTAQYTEKQWEAAVKEVADIGMKYLILLAVGIGGRAFYNSRLLDKWKIVCPDPVGIILKSAEKYGMKVFVSAEWHGDWPLLEELNEPLRVKNRLAMMDEVAELYGDYPAFYGWYFPTEGYIDPVFPEECLEYIRITSSHARKLTDNRPLLFAPYYTYKAEDMDSLASQISRMDVDIIAWQDEVGCRRQTPQESERAYEVLRKAHDKAGRAALWADVETFDWETPEINSHKTPLVPTQWKRLYEQLKAVSPYVDVVTVYQYQGLLSQPYSSAPAGRSDAVELYLDYHRWLQENYPAKVKRRYTFRVDKY